MKNYSVYYQSGKWAGTFSVIGLVDYKAALEICIQLYLSYQVLAIPILRS